MRDTSPSFGGLRKWTAPKRLTRSCKRTAKSATTTRCALWASGPGRIASTTRPSGRLSTDVRLAQTTVQQERPGELVLVNRRLGRALRHRQLSQGSPADAA